MTAGDAPKTTTHGTESGSAAAVDRAQTLPDFVAGIGIFLVTIAFIVMFVPDLTAPYQDQENPVVAERIASDLSGNLLAQTASSPSHLDERCTLAFFLGAEATDCPFNAGNTTNEQLGVSSGYSVNVTVKRVVDGGDAELLCGDNGEIGPCGTDPLAVGPPAPQEKRSAATARRTVSVDGTDAVLEVTVW